MANIHVLLRENGTFQLVYHVPVANGNNAAGVNYRTALVRSGLGGTTRLPDGDGTAGTISAAEKTQITAGSVYEVVRSLDVTQGGAQTTGPQIQAYITEDYTAAAAEATQTLGRMLAQYGRTF